MSATDRAWLVLAAVSGGCIITSGDGDTGTDATTGAVATTSGDIATGSGTAGTTGPAASTGGAETTVATTTGAIPMVDPREVCPDYATHVAYDCLDDPEAYATYLSYCTVQFSYAPEYGGACVTAIDDYFACLITAPCRDITSAVACPDSFSEVETNCGF